MIRCRVGCEFVYESPGPTPIVLQVQARPDGEHRILEERDSFSADPATHQYLDVFGNRCTRLIIPEGRSSIAYDALVEVDEHPDITVPEAQQQLVQDLPDEAILYLLPSRYCQSDQLQAIAWDLFGWTEPGWARVQTVCDWVHNNVTFMAGSMGLATALDVFLLRRGVCRDFAHLAVTLCRALNIPARYGFGYMGDIRITPMPGAMDFHAWFEVYLGGRWYIFDCRHNTPRIGRIFIGKGRDAVDVAMVTAFGGAQLTGMTVWSDEVPESATLDEPPRISLANSG